VDEAGLWQRAISYTADGRTIRTLADQDHVTLLVLSSFEDIAFGTAKLKQPSTCTCSSGRWRRGPWTGLASRGARRRERGRICREVLGLTLALFSASEELAPLASAIGGAPFRDAALALLGGPEEETKRWFCQHYPGSLAWYRVWHTYADFPRNLTRGSRLRAVRLNLRIAREVLLGRRR
jgi:hypothetical protein